MFRGEKNRERRQDSTEMQSVREPGQGSLNLLPALVNLHLKNRSYHILLLAQSFGWTQAIKKVTTGWKQIKTPQIVPFGFEPVKCTLGSFSKTWGLLLSKKIPESENSHITVRLQGSWVRGKIKWYCKSCYKLGTSDNVHIAGTQDPVEPRLFCLFVLWMMTTTANV